MSREARELSKSGFYHIVFRGINHQNIFEEEQDFEYMLDIFKNLKQEMQFKIQCMLFNDKSRTYFIKRKPNRRYINNNKKIINKICSEIQ